MNPRMKAVTIQRGVPPDGFGPASRGIMHGSVNTVSSEIATGSHAFVDTSGRKSGAVLHMQAERQKQPEEGNASQNAHGQKHDLTLQSTC